MIADPFVFRQGCQMGGARGFAKAVGPAGRDRLTLSTGARSGAGSGEEIAGAAGMTF
jgi:hypothetical protein